MIKKTQFNFPVRLGEVRNNFKNNIGEAKNGR
jgi:hypothetical protein